MRMISKNPSVPSESNRTTSVTKSNSKSSFNISTSRKTPNHKYYKLLRTCERSGNWERAIYLLRQMKYDSDLRLNVNFNASSYYNMAFRACATAGEIDRALDLFWSMCKESDVRLSKYKLEPESKSNDSSIMIPAVSTFSSILSIISADTSASNNVDKRQIRLDQLEKIFTKFTEYCCFYAA